MEIQSFSPEIGNDISAPSLYVITLSLEDLQALTDAGDVLQVPSARLPLAPTEFLTDACVLVTEALAGGSVTNVTATVGLTDSSYRALQSIPDIAGPVAGSFYAGAMVNTVAVTASSTTAFLRPADVTFSQLLDSVSGACTPNAATAVGAGVQGMTGAAVSNNSMRLQSAEFGVTASEITIVFNPDSPLSGLTTGSLKFFFYTRTIPTFSI